MPREELAFSPYLDTVCARVSTHAPEAWVADLRAELGCHLACTANAYEELGETPEQAITSACRSLGDPSKLGQRWERYWLSRRTEPFRKTFQLAFARFLGAAVISLVMLLTAARLSVSGSAFVPLRDLLTVTSVLGAPILAGIAVGIQSRGRRALGAAAAVMVVAAVTALIATLVPGDDPVGLQPFFWQVELLYWLPLGSAAAGITGVARTLWKRCRRLQSGA